MNINITPLKRILRKYGVQDISKARDKMNQTISEIIPLKIIYPSKNKTQYLNKLYDELKSIDPTYCKKCKCYHPRTNKWAHRRNKKLLRSGLF